MKVFKDRSAQGDVYIRRVDSLPNSGITADKPVGTAFIVTHSETGHHHTMERGDVKDPAVEMFSTADNPLIAWIKVNRPTPLVHNRDHDVHESILFGEGTYEIRRQREYTPEGFRKARD